MTSLADIIDWQHCESVTVQPTILVGIENDFNEVEEGVCRASRATTMCYWVVI